MMQEKKWQRRPRVQQEMVYGIRPVMEAIDAGREIERIILRVGSGGENIFTLQRIAKQREIPIQRVPAPWFSRLGSRNHQGIVAYISPITYQPLEQLIPAIYERGEEPLILLADGITDVHNLGAIARTAECVGAHALVVPARGSAQIGPDAVKTSAGALQHINVCRVASIPSTLEFLKQSGLTIVAASEQGRELYSNAQLRGPIALVLGDEGEGLAPATIQMADVLVKIPIHGTLQSLNVSVAAGIILYEIDRQRRTHTEE